MDSLEEFEKALAAEKAERERAAQEKEDRRERRHRHHNHRREPSSERHRTSDRHRHRHRDSRDKDERRDRDDERNRRRHHRSRDDSDEDDHRHKRSRHSRDEGEEEGRHGRGHRSRDHSRDRRRDGRGRRSPMDIKDLKQSDPKEDLPLPDEERAPTDPNRPVRDSWMTAPSALDIDYIHRGAKRRSPSPAKEEPQRVLHKRELNVRLGELEKREQELELPVEPDVNYEFGDEGSQWRMTKLKAVYTIAEQTGRPVDDVAVERYGNLREFDDAREEKMEMDRRRVYGEGYVGKEKPTGDLYAERMARTRPEPQRSPSPQPTQGLVIEDMIKPAPPMDQSALNRMRAQLMKAKLRNAPEAAKLEEEYNAAMAAFSTGAASNNAVVLDASHSRMLAGARAEVKAVTNKRGLERGQVEANEDMSLEDMIREERRTRGQPGGEGRRLAERIAKDGRFDNDLDYLDENAEKLAKRVHRSDAALKNMAVTEYKKLNRILDACPLCFHEDRAPPQNQPLAPVVSLGTRTYLTLPTAPELTGAEGGAVAVPLSHHTNLLECDDDEWEELRNFMKSLTRLYHDQGRDVLFYENAASPQRRPHAALVAVPIPYELGDTAPAFFREAMLAADEEWAQHRKVIDTARKARDEGLGRLAFRRSLAKEMPYFHVWFNLDGGLAHVVEDADRWPKGDLFAREVIGGMLDTEPDVIKRQGRWTRNDDRVDGFKKRWRKFDWTRVLAEEG